MRPPSLKGGWGGTLLTVRCERAISEILSEMEVDKFGTGRGWLLFGISGHHYSLGLSGEKNSNSPSDTCYQYAHHKPSTLKHCPSSDTRGRACLHRLSAPSRSPSFLGFCEGYYVKQGRGPTKESSPKLCVSRRTLEPSTGNSWTEPPWDMPLNSPFPHLSSLEGS